MGLYGQIMNVTINPIEALANETSTMIGMGLTMEGQEGNEIMYDVLLDQAWSSTPLDSAVYFRDWATSRYHGAASLPEGLCSAWNVMRQSVFNNTEIVVANAVTKSIFELSPNTTGLLNRTGHHPTTIQYKPADLVTAWESFYNAAAQEPSLWDNPSYTFDLTDITRQVLANAFYPAYTAFVSASNTSQNASYSFSTAAAAGERMTSLLADLDALLTSSGHEHFSLAAWIAQARAWAGPSANATCTVAYYEYNARNQITLWGPTGQISDYASKSWGGLISSYYLPRWQLFVSHTLNGTTASNGVNAALSADLLKFEEAWQTQTWGEELGQTYAPPRLGELQRTLARIVRAWPDIFARVRPRSI